MSTILSVKSLSKTYKSGEKSLKVLDDINFELSKGDTLAIVGPSGSGKTTLLGLCAGLDQADKGTININGLELSGLSEDQLAALRNEYVGFIFQNFQLMPTLTALENIMVPLELKRQKNAEASAIELLDKVGLSERADHYPAQLSGGEQQRVAIARAFANEPVLLFADEPTGNLDEETGSKIEKLLFDLNSEKRTSLVLVTHDHELAEKTNQIIRLKGGRMVPDNVLSKTTA